MISPSAVVQTETIGNGVSIAEFVVIRPGVIIGSGVVIHPHVVIETGTEIGDGVEIFPGAYIGKEPKGAGATARIPEFEPRVVIGANSSIGPNAVVFADVEIGNNTLLGDGASIREKCRIGSYCIVGRYVTVNYNARIGHRTKIMDLAIVTGNCTIGENVFVSMGVGMANDNAIGRLGYDDVRALGPTIEDGAAIGVGATLLPGITIGRGSIVGAGSVVTKDVEAHTLAVGVPARFAKRLDPADGT